MENPSHVVELLSSLLILIGYSASSRTLTVQTPASDHMVSAVRVWLQEGAECVVHGGQVQVLRLAAVGLHPRLSFLFVLFALIGERPPADGAVRATLQTRQDHLGEILLEPLEVLPERAQTKVRWCPGKRLQVRMDANTHSQCQCLYFRSCFSSTSRFCPQSKKRENWQNVCYRGFSM